MAITLADFNKIWASTSPLTPYSFSESNYKEGWNFIGATPPARQMWDFLQKRNDEKMQYIVNNICVPVATESTANSGIYYNTSVPSGKVFSNFNTIGGKTIAWNQLVDSGTSSVTLISGHKYYTLISGSASIQTGAGSAISVTGGTDKVSDLTLMFGSGNEPSAVADFQALFPNYASMAYNAGTLLSAGTDKVISKDSSNNVVATMPIPSAIQSLDGYGWSAGSVYNYVDFERKVFVKRVGKVVLDGTQTLTTTNWLPTANGVGWLYAYNITNNKIVGNWDKSNIVSTSLLALEYANIFNNQLIGIATYINNTSGICIYQTNTSLTDATAINAYLSANPITVYYELATPIETDISDILGADGIACESGGSLTFANSNGDNYRLPVPVSLDWLDGTDGLMTVQDKAKLEVAYEAVNNDFSSLIIPSQKSGSSIRIASNQTVVWKTNTTGVIAFQFPFITKNTSYNVRVSSLAIEGIGSISLENVSFSKKETTGCCIDITQAGTAGQAKTTYSFISYIEFA